MKNNKKNLASIIAAGAIAASTSGCACLVNGTTQTLPYSCNTSNATCYIDGRPYSSSGTAVLERRKDHTFTFEKEGYTSDTRMVKSRLSAWFLGNIIFWYGAPIGMLIDFAAGSTWYLDPEYFQGNIYPLKPKRKEEDLNFKYAKN